MATREYDKNIRDFITQHADLFRFWWQREDIPTDAEWELVHQAWNKYTVALSWEEFEARITELVQRFDWSLQQQQQQQDDHNYEYGDFLFDSDRENRYFGRR